MTTIPSVQVGGTGPDKLVLRMSGLQWQGDPEFLVTVDGAQVGGVQDVAAQFGPDTQDFVISGDFGTGAHTVGIQLLDAAQGDEWWQQRALEVQNVSVDGMSVAGGGFQMDSNGTSVLGFAAAGWSAPVTTVRAGADTLALTMNEDEWQGDAAFTVSVDGVQVGGTNTVGAIHGANTQEFDVKGDFGPGAHHVEVDFLNDNWSWFNGADRNLYLKSATFDGATVPTGGLALLSQGAQSLDFVAAPSAAPDTLVISAAEDAYQGDAQFSVSVDGVAVAGAYTVQASETDGASQDIVVKGDWGAGPHSVAVTFLNDAYGGGPSADRNLYVKNVSYDGISQRTEMPLGSTGDTFTLAVPAAAPPAPAPGGLSLLGVNLSGAEYGTPTGAEGTDYRYPAGGELDYWSAQGMNMVRLPVSWERLQPVQGGDLDAGQLARIDAVVARAASDGMKVDIDLHGYGYGYGNLVGSSGTPDAALADFWGKMATHFAGSPNVMFDVMNEPHDQTATQWAAAAQGAVDAIRGAGATQEILVSGTGWDEGKDWTSSGNAAAMATVHDSLGNMAFEVHQYFDDGSGTSTAVSSPTVGPDRLADVTAWARTGGEHLFLGEFASGADAAGTAALGNTLAFMKGNADVWQGGSYWGAGWQDGYMFNPDPTHGVASAQSAVLSAYAPGH